METILKINSKKSPTATNGVRTIKNADVETIMKKEIFIHDGKNYKPMIPLANKIMSELNIVEKMNQTV